MLQLPGSRCIATIMFEPRSTWRWRWRRGVTPRTASRMLRYACVRPWRVCMQRSATDPAQHCCFVRSMGSLRSDPIWGHSSTRSSGCGSWGCRAQPNSTTAEFRVLGYLPTHLTFAEIGAELFISRHTVHSHATAIYRKFGVTSRSSSACPERHCLSAGDDHYGRGPTGIATPAAWVASSLSKPGTDSSGDRYQSRKPRIVAPTIA